MPEALFQRRRRILHGRGNAIDCRLLRFRIAACEDHFWVADEDTIDGMQVFVERKAVLKEECPSRGLLLDREFLHRCNIA